MEVASVERTRVPADGEPMTRADEDEVVAAVLNGVDGDHGVERFDDASLGAYQSLALSRGLSLEAVLRAACRGDLRSVVSRPAKGNQS
ncbi:MAG: hypothetical protein WKF73_12245 [Nocardioidaceae bacterium]